MLSEAEIVQILKSSSPEVLSQIAENAFQIRNQYLGRRIWLRGLLEFSNYCVRNCLYCGLRRENQRLVRYRMDEEAIFEAAKQAIDSGIQTIVLQSGDDLVYPRQAILSLIQRIKTYAPQTAITLSLGERPIEDYRAFYAAGADRYLLKHETVNELLYATLHPGQSLQKRLQILSQLKQIGYQVGAGNIVGLPGQTETDLARDILLLKEIDVDMAGIGPFMPQKDTPLAHYPKGSVELTLKVLSLTRLVIPRAHLAASTALVSAQEDKRNVLRQAFLAGADVVMLNFTPNIYRNLYQIYDGKKLIHLEDVQAAAESVGLEICWDRGDALK